MKAVVDRVIPLHVPAVVVLVHAVAVNPHDRRMLPGPIKILRHEQPTRHLLAVGARIVDEFGLDERRAVHRSRHRIREPRRLARCEVDDEQVR
jgi:hypothetical protein